MNDYISNYEKSIKYSLLPQKDHIINLIHNDPNSAPVHADMLEESGLEHDNETLEHLRNHSAPFQVEKKNGKIKVRAVRPIYRHINFLQDEEYHDLPQELVDNLGTPEGNDNLINHLYDLTDNQNHPPYHYPNDLYSSEMAAGKDDHIIHHGNYIISHNPHLGYIGLEHSRQIPIKEYEKIKKLTEERLSR